MRAGGVTGEEGNAIVNPVTGAIDHFTPSHSADLWSPDGRRVAYVRVGSFLTDPIGLYVRDLAGSPDRLVHDGNAHQVAWSPDSTRLAASVSSRGGERGHMAIFDAVTGTELETFSHGNDPMWSPDGKSIALSSYDLEDNVQRILVQPSDGSPPRKVATGTQPSWSPDGLSLTYIRNGALWFTSLGDGVETPLLRPSCR